MDKNLSIEILDKNIETPKIKETIKIHANLDQISPNNSHYNLNSTNNNTNNNDREFEYIDDAQIYNNETQFRVTFDNKSIFHSK